MSIANELRCNPVDCPGDCWKCKASDVLNAIDALHQATEPILDDYTGLGDSWCEECGPDQPWPCTTARLLHSGVITDG